MNFNQKKFRIGLLIFSLILFAIAFALDSVSEKHYHELLLELARTHESQPNPYIVETEAKKMIIPESPGSWDSIYLPSTVPEFYELGSWAMSDTYNSCRFSRPIDYKNETSLENSYPCIHFTRWNHKKETIPWEKSFLPPILKTGEFQICDFERKTEEQLELQKNSTLQTKTYNDKEYYFYDETQNGKLLLWYDEQNTFALSVEPGTGNKTHVKITLEDMLSIADSVENYN